MKNWYLLSEKRKQTSFKGNKKGSNLLPFSYSFEEY